MNTPTPNTPTQPSLGALRAAREINEQLGTENVVIAQDWLCEVIDRETGTAELISALENSLVALGEYMKLCPNERALDLGGTITEVRVAIAKHNARTP